ncbi:MAG: DMT family transporter [Deltaproteobacteria bacterium]|jgi:drug/metabolite transporter (DMT)-like permease|nr:DMT family transporter [Deltaproteobacteria bacterium]
MNKGILFALLATIGWSFNFIFGRELSSVIPPCTLAAMRWTVAFLAILPFALPVLIREREYFKKHLLYYLLISFFGTTYFNTAMYMAAHATPALNLSLIACTTPIFTIILSRLLFKEAIHSRRIVGISIALLGVILLLSRGNPDVLTSLSFNGHDLLMLSSAFAFSVYTLLVRKKPSGNSTLSFLAATFGLGLLPIIPASAWELLHGAEVYFKPELITGLVYMGLIASLLCFWLWGKAVAAIGPAKTTVIYYSLPFFCGDEAIIFLGEPVTWVHFTAGALILGGLILATKERGLKSG